jgi:plastocyanin
MSRRLHFALVTGVVSVALLGPAPSQAATYYGRVGPGAVITLKNAAGVNVARIRAGTHTFVIRDRSSSHNFHLVKPGTDRRTGVSFRGSRTWRVRIARGTTYRYRCDPHPSSMRGSFRGV